MLFLICAVVGVVIGCLLIFKELLDDDTEGELDEY